MWAPFLGWEDLLEEEMATHSRILAWKIPWTEKPDGSPWGCKESDTSCLNICSGVGSVNHIVAQFSVFWGTSILFSIVAAPIYIPPNSVEGFHFLRILSSIRYLSPTDILIRRRQWHRTPVLLPGKSRGWRSLVGCSPWGR